MSKEIGDLVQMGIRVKQDQNIYLKEKGINLSKFVRQAIEAHRNNDTFVYDPLKEE